MPDPAAQDDVQRALRLGWVIAEARGRYRLGDNPILRPRDPLPKRGLNDLPLADERSPAEQRIEAEHVLLSLITELKDSQLDHEIKGLPALATALNDAKAKGQDQTACWEAVSGCLFKIDLRLQDYLAAEAFGMASAYQLGRALAEVFWALDPAAHEADWSSWTFLLGDHRVREVGSLVERLSGTLPAMTPAVIGFSLTKWRQVAADSEWRSTKGSYRALLRQSYVWRDLLLTNRDPRDLVDPTALLKSSRRLGPIIASFAPEVALLVAGAGLLSWAVGVLNGHGGGQALASALAVVGGFGVTGAGLAARAKNAAHSVVQRLQDTLYLDVLNDVVTLANLPPSPRRGGPFARRQGSKSEPPSLPAVPPRRRTGSERMP